VLFSPESSAGGFWPDGILKHQTRQKKRQPKLPFDLPGGLLARD
jgi:hypothetical protein